MLLMRTSNEVLYLDMKSGRVSARVNYVVNCYSSILWRYVVKQNVLQQLKGNGNKNFYRLI